MATLTKLLLVANTALVYLITLSWPESLFWSDVLASIYRAFSTSYVFDLVFGGLGIVAFLGLTRPTVLQFLNTVTGRILQIGAAVLLLFVNFVGFAITPYTTISFSKIDLTGFKDAGLLAQWVRSSSDVAEPSIESERSELFAYAFFRELKRNNFSREQRDWYLGTLSLVELVRPFEICISHPAIDRCSRHKQIYEYEPTKFVDFASQAVQLDPGNVWAASALGAGYDVLGKGDRAIKTLEAAYIHFGKQSETALILANRRRRSCAFET